MKSISLLVTISTFAILSYGCANDRSRAESSIDHDTERLTESVVKNGNPSLSSEGRRDASFELSLEDIGKVQKKCAPPSGWHNIVNRFGDGYYLFGEMHGTQETPKAVAEFACALSVLSDENIHLAFELTEFIPHILDVNSPNLSGDPRADVISAFPEFWLYPSGDGRRSEAVMGTILRLISLQNDGANITIGSMGLLPEQQKNISERKIKKREAEKVNLQSMAEGSSSVIVLSGNWHTPRYVSILNEVEGITPISFDHYYGEGFATNCMEECTVNRLHAEPFYQDLRLLSSDVLVLLPNIQGTYSGFLTIDEPVSSPIIQENPFKD